MIAAAGAFSPGPGPLRYAGMLPDSALIPVFSVLTVLPLIAMAVGASRAWRAWYEGSLWATRPRILGRSIRNAVAEILAHRKFSTCKERRLRPWAHRAVLYSFLGLAAISGVIAVLLLAGRPYPLAMGNPLKVLSNVFAALLIGGAGYFLLARVKDASRGNRSTFFDWAFLVNVLLAGITGVATEALRVADVRAWAYPVYFVHLVVVLTLAMTLPYTKLAHAVYRVLAVAGREYEVLFATAPAPPEHPQHHWAGHGAGPRRSAQLAGDAGLKLVEATPSMPEQLLEMGHEELAAYSDDEITAAYYALRDEVEPRGEGSYYPNLKRLAGTAFEREKDRREVRALVGAPDKTEWEAWYEKAAEQPCTWWLENDLVARHALTTCLSCGMCTSVCPAAEHFEEYDPRCIVDVALSGDEGSHRRAAQVRRHLVLRTVRFLQLAMSRGERHHGPHQLAAHSGAAEGLPPRERAGQAAVRRPPSVGGQPLEPGLQPLLPQRRPGRSTLTSGRVTHDGRPSWKNSSCGSAASRTWTGPLPAAR